MIVTNPKLHHDWREDWEGTHVRRVGNNWRITLRMRYKKKARGEVLEHMVLHGVKYNIIVILKRKIQLFELCGRSQAQFEFDHSRVVTAVNRHYKAAMYL